MERDATERELAEIIGRKPHWIIRWGITVIFLIAILISIIWILGFSNLPAIFGIS